MGMLDFIFGDKEKQQAKKIEGLRKKLLNIWVQSPDRYYAADQLFEIASTEAFEALLERFKAQVSNTTYDIEEKQYICDRMINIGEPIVDVVKDVVRKEEEQVNWPMRILEDVLPDAEMVAFIQELLGSMDNDYQRNPEKKEQLILRSGGYKDYEELAKEVARFTVDDSESIRFQALTQIVERDTDWATEALRNNLRLEDSGRLLTMVTDWFLAHPEVKAADMSKDSDVQFIREHLPRGVVLTDEGHLRNA